MSNGKRAVIYARYSSDMQKKTSIEGQVMVCKKVAERLGLDIVEIYADEAQTGQKERRRLNYQRLLDDARARKFDYIIVEQWNRLSRATTVTRLWNLFNFHNIGMLDQRGVVATETDISIAALYNSIYKPQLATFVRRGHEVSVRNGRFPGSPPYGYRRIEGKPGEIEPNPEQATIIRRIFTEYVAGRSTRMICADLSREGVLSPGGGAVWNHNSLTSGRHGSGMLGNQIYIGEVRWNTRTTIVNPETELDERRATPVEQHVVHRSERLRIISQPLWDAATKARTDRAVQMFGPSGKPTRRAVVPRNAEHPLAGALRCQCCKGNMRIAQSSRNGAPRAACANAHQRSACDHTRSFDMDVLLKDVGDYIEERLTSPEMVKAAFEAWKEERKHDRKKDSKRSELEITIRALTTEIERLSYAVANSRRKPDELLKLIDETDAKRENAQKQLALLGDATDSKVVPFDHPNFAEAFCLQTRHLVAALRANPKAIETRLAFKTLVGAVMVHPTAKRMPYRINVYLNSNAVGAELFSKNRRKAAGIAASAWYDNVRTENSVQTLSQHGNSLISLGVWQRAA